MSEYNYKYEDSAGKYTNPETGVMWNKLGISNKDELFLKEHEYTTAALIDFRLQDFVIKDLSSLLDIHKFLFEDIYEWAGEVRTVEISKQGSQFFSTSKFDSGFVHINCLIADYRSIDASDTSSLAKSLAEILDNVNHLHPFREGNGRAQREFIYRLGNEKGFVIELGVGESVRQAYLEGTINGDINLLTHLFESLLSKDNQ